MTRTLKLNWEEHYQTTPMEKLHWYTKSADNEVMSAIKKFCPAKGNVLDLGTGPGTMAIILAKTGYDVTATDISASAVSMAKRRAGKTAGKIKFIVDDITDTKLNGKYDIIHDRGCFHCLNEAGVIEYVKNVFKLLKDDGILLIKTFYITDPMEDGPNKYSEEDMKKLFSHTFKFLHCEETTYPSTLKVDPLALFCVLKKIRDGS